MIPFYDRKNLSLWMQIMVALLEIIAVVSAILFVIFKVLPPANGTSGIKRSKGFR